MRNSVDITRGYQVWKMLLRSILAIFVCLIFNIVVYINFFDVKAMRVIIGIVMSVAYGGIIYTGASTFGKFDRKPYTSLKVEPWRSIVWGVLIGAINLAMFGIYKLNWVNAELIDGVPGIMTMVINGIFYVWSSPFMGFIYGSTNGNIPWAVPVLMIAIPVVASFLGYLAGSKNFLLSEKVNEVMFEKEDSEE